MIWLRWISSDAASASSGNRGQQHQKDPVLAQVDDLARAIVEEAEAARSHNKEEVQRVAQLAEKVIYLLPYLRPPLLTRNQDTITELLDNLRGALRTMTAAQAPSLRPFGPDAQQLLEGASRTSSGAWERHRAELSSPHDQRRARAKHYAQRVTCTKVTLRTLYIYSSHI